MAVSVLIQQCASQPLQSCSNMINATALGSSLNVNTNFKGFLVKCTALFLRSKTGNW